MSTEYEHDASLNSAQARYDAMDPPDDAIVLIPVCGHCKRAACGNVRRGLFHAAEECSACNQPMCVKCMDHEDRNVCPALGRAPYPYEQEGVTLAQWQAARISDWNRHAKRGWCSREHANAMIRDVMENYGPQQ